MITKNARKIACHDSTRPRTAPRTWTPSPPVSRIAWIESGCW
ncbi:MAG: hypothetical protein R3B09_16325 [Nannocystaceae bacterium]